MKRSRREMRPLVPILLLVLALILAGCHEREPDLGDDTTDGDGPGDSPTDGASPFIFTDSFEGGIDNWTQGADVPDDPNEPGDKVAWNITVSDERAKEGSRSVNFTIDGRQDDGTIWIVRSFETRPDTRYWANVSAHAWSASESFNTIAHFVMYLGTEPPQNERSFPQSGDSGNIDDRSGGLRQPLNLEEGWREYGFEWGAPATEDGVLHVTIGITVVWETEMTYFADDLQVTLDPLSE